MRSVHEYINPLAKKYHDNADAVIAEGAKKYMRNQYDYFGIYAPLRKEIHLEFVRDHGFPSDDELEPIIKELWALPERDFQAFGLFLAEKSSKKASSLGHGRTFPI